MAFDLLERLEQFLASTHNVRFLMEALALKALAWQAHGQQAAAVATLAQAIRLAAPGGYIRIFADLGGQIDGLLAQVAAQGVAPLLVAAYYALLSILPHHNRYPHRSSRRRTHPPLQRRQAQRAIVRLISRPCLLSENKMCCACSGGDRPIKRLPQR